MAVHSPGQKVEESSQKVEVSARHVGHLEDGTYPARTNTQKIFIYNNFLSISHFSTH